MFLSLSKWTTNIASLGVDDQIDDGNHLKKQIEEFGFRGKLEFISYVTGLLYVELDYHSDAPAPTFVQVESEEMYLEIPTLKSAISDIQKRIAEAAASVAKIDLAGISLELRELLTGMNEFLDAIPVEEIGEDVRISIAKFRELLESGKNRYRPR